MESYEQFRQWYEQGGLKEKLHATEPTHIAYAALERYTLHKLCVVVPTICSMQLLVHSTLSTTQGLIGMLPADIRRILYSTYGLAGKLARMSSWYRVDTKPILESLQYAPIIGRDLLVVLKLVRDILTINE